MGGNLIHQRRDGLAAQLACLRELLQLGSILASHLLQHLPDRYAPLNQLQDLLTLQLLLGPSLAERQGDTLHLFKTAAQLERLIDNALHGPRHGVDAERLEAHEHLGDFTELQGGILGKVLDPG